MLEREIIERLTKRRKELGLSQVELSVKIGAGGSQVGYWERRSHSPSLPNFVAWAQTLGVEVDLR